MSLCNLVFCVFLCFCRSVEGEQDVIVMTVPCTVQPGGGVSMRCFALE